MFPLDVLLQLRMYVKGATWLSLCQSDEGLTIYATWNREFWWSYQGSFPPGITHLSMETSGTTKILPKGVRSLVVQRMEGSFPEAPALTDLTIGSMHLLDDSAVVFPSSLRCMRLRLVSHISGRFGGVMLPKLSRLYLNLVDGEPQTLFFPQSLRVLDIGLDFNVSDLNFVRELHNLCRLTVHGFGAIDSAPSFPDKLQYLILCIPLTLDLRKVHLPQGLKLLHLEYRCWTTMDINIRGLALPSGLTNLYLGNFTQPLSGWTLPRGLETLYIYFNQNPVVDDWNLPIQLKTLWIQGMFNRPMQSIKLPPNLQELHLGDSFNEAVQGWKLPHTLRKLSLGDSFNRRISGWKLPDSLEKFSIGTKFMCRTNKLNFPKSIRHISITNRTYAEICALNAAYPSARIETGPYCR